MNRYKKVANLDAEVIAHASSDLDVDGIAERDKLFLLAVAPSEALKILTTKEGDILELIRDLRRQHSLTLLNIDKDIIDEEKPEVLEEEISTLIEVNILDPLWLSLMAPWIDLTAEPISYDSLSEKDQTIVDLGNEINKVTPKKKLTVEEVKNLRADLAEYCKLTEQEFPDMSVINALSDASDE